MKIKTWLNGQIVEEEFPTILHALDMKRVFTISVYDLTHFEITEGCDNYFSVVLTKDQLITLGHEIVNLALQYDKSNAPKL
jgi:hypothetical protein